MCSSSAAGACAVAALHPFVTSSSSSSSCPSPTTTIDIMLIIHLLLAALLSGEVSFVSPLSVYLVFSAASTKSGCFFFSVYHVVRVHQTNICQPSFLPLLSCPFYSTPPLALSSIAHSLAASFYCRWFLVLDLCDMLLLFSPDRVLSVSIDLHPPIDFYPSLA